MTTFELIVSLVAGGLAGLLARFTLPQAKGLLAFITAIFAPGLVAVVGFEIIKALLAGGAVNILYYSLAFGLFVFAACWSCVRFERHIVAFRQSLIKDD